MKIRYVLIIIFGVIFLSLILPIFTTKESELTDFNSVVEKYGVTYVDTVSLEKRIDFSEALKKDVYILSNEEYTFSVTKSLLFYMDSDKMSGLDIYRVNGLSGRVFVVKYSSNYYAMIKN